MTTGANRTLRESREGVTSTHALAGLPAAGAAWTVTSRGNGDPEPGCS